jgi:patatin-like phospholipase/acyl hydrolase
MNLECAEHESYCLIGLNPELYWTYQSCELHLDCTIWKAAQATSAMPTFFKPIEIRWKQLFIDGGNNPSRLVLDAAKRLFKSDYC